MIVQFDPSPFISLNPWTVLFTLVNLLILYKFMKKLLFNPVKKMIDSRQKEIDDLYDDANKFIDDAAAMKSQYETCLAEAHAEKDAIIKDAYRKAQIRDEAMLREAQEKAAQTLRHADEQIALEKKRAMNDIKDEVSVMAVDIASAVLARDIKKSEHSNLIDSFIENLGENHD